jgi:hypothetical protein
LPLSTLYVARAVQDDAATINIALQRGLHLIFTPGVYNLAYSLVVRNANTVVLGLGLATLVPTRGTPAIIVEDVDGVIIAGLLIDAGRIPSVNLLQIGSINTSKVDHSVNPTAVLDVSCRIGGAASTANAMSCMVVNSRDVILDNIWLWRADHGIDPDYIGWVFNPCTNGLIVNSDNVSAYGLFVEHFKEFQTLWNGNNGNVYFYQSEAPYDVPNQRAWIQNNKRGYPSYKVSNNVTSHNGRGIGVYCNFKKPVQLDNAIETPQGPGIVMQHLVIVWLDGVDDSSINHIINGTGNSVYDRTNMVSTSPN